MKTTKEYRYDAKDVFRRVATGLNRRGVKVESADVPRSDGSVIYLPNLKTKMTRDELILLRFFFAHELGHIEFTDFCRVHNLCTLEGVDGDVPPKIRLAVYNMLEDLRIESCMSEKYKGTSGIFSVGRPIAFDKWDKDQAEKNANGLSYVDSDPSVVLAELTELIYGGRYAPERYRLPTHRHHEAISEFYDRIDQIDHKTPERVILNLAQLIWRKVWDNFEPEEQQEFHKKNTQSCESRACAPVTGNQIIRGAGESMESDGDPDCDPGAFDPTEEFRNACTGRSEMNKRTHNRRRIEEGHEHYEFGLKYASLAGRLIERFRGLDLGGYSKPRASGTKIAVGKIAEFLSGNTINILKRPQRAVRTSLAASLCIDDSGSMSGGLDLYKPAWKSAAMLGIACERANVPLQISRYDCDWHLVKDFFERIASLKHALTVRGSGGTHISQAIEASAFELKGRREQNKVLFLLTDGLGEGGDRIQAAIDDAAKSGVAVVPILFSHIIEEYDGYAAQWSSCKTKVYVDDDDLQSSFGRKLISELCNIF